VREGHDTKINLANIVADAEKKKREAASVTAALSRQQPRQQRDNDPDFVDSDDVPPLM
jgi:hypothetical protein